MANVPTTGELNINIIFEDGGGKRTPNGDTQNPSNPVQEGLPSAKNPTESGAQSTVRHFALNAMQSVGQKVVNTAVSNIGFRTGNYAKQSTAESAINAVTTGAGIAMLAYSTNIYVAIAALAVQAISMGVEAKNEQLRIDRENFAYSQKARKLGFTVNRSR